MNLVQIGVNIAHDDFSKIVNQLNNNGEVIDNLLLVEPLEECNESIKNCYSNYNYFLENIVINGDENKKTETFLVSQANWLSTLREGHIERYHHNETPQQRTIPSMTLNELFNKYNLKKIDILFIDTEGWDDVLIKSINYDMYDINTIYYEDFHINNESLMEFLNQKNYDVRKADFSDGYSSVAVKKQ